MSPTNALYNFHDGRGLLWDLLPDVWEMVLLRPMIEPIVLLILAVAPFLRSIRGPFLYDDPWLFAKNPPQVPPTWAHFRLNPRAMTHVIDGWLWRAFGVNETGLDGSGTVIIQPAVPWHVVSILFHVGSVFAFWALASYILTPWRALGAAALFAVHPLQVSSVCYVSARAGMQSAFFAFLGFLHGLAGGWHWPLAAVSHYFAFKSKPDGLLYMLVYPGAILLWFFL